MTSQAMLTWTRPLDGVLQIEIVFVVGKTRRGGGKTSYNSQPYNQANPRTCNASVIILGCRDKLESVDADLWP